MTEQTRGFRHMILDSGIHRFDFEDASRQTAHQYMETFKALYADLPAGTTLRLLLDFRVSGMPPFKALAASLRDFTQREDVQQRIAHLYDDQMFTVVMQNLVTHSRLDNENYQRQFFRGAQAGEAIAWLLEDD